MAGIFFETSSKLSFKIFSTNSTGTSYGKSQSTTARDNSRDRLITSPIALLFMILIFMYNLCYEESKIYVIIKINIPKNIRNGGKV